MTSAGGGHGSPSNNSSWAKRPFLSQEGVVDEAWPDLLMNRKSMEERRRSCRSMDSATDPITIERNNLIAISQLVLKRLVDSSLRQGRKVENEQDFLPLQQLFVLLEMVFKHGFKSGRRLVYGQREVWQLLQQLEQLASCEAATEIGASVRELNIKTSAGRARAWFRLALMQKNLPLYFKTLIEHKEDILYDYYHPEALLCSDEAVLLSGLLASLNVVDFNLCIKDTDFDRQENVIDLSMYLRRKEDIGRCYSIQNDADQEVSEAADGRRHSDISAAELQAIVDQKNYVEEVNRNLATNVSNLQAKVSGLTSTNLLMKEDLAICQRKLKESDSINQLLQEQVDQAAEEANRQQRLQLEASVNSIDPSAESELEQQLSQEQAKTRQAERELSLEVQMKAECEIAMKLMEKDVHEKQDTIVSLRAQLEDIKAINIEMYLKLAECKKTIEVKSDMIKKLEEKSSGLMDTMQQLDDKFVASERNLATARSGLLAAEQELVDRRDEQQVLGQDLRIEREWRQRLQETSQADREEVASLRMEVDFLKQVSNDYENIRQENLRLKEINRESDKTLEELGQQLSWNKLQLDSMKEVSKVAGAWEPDAGVVSCKICEKDFSLSRRKHHCRNCGGIFCDKCSDNKMELPSSAKKLRVCDNCYVMMLERQAK